MIPIEEFETQTQITYGNWQSVLPIRSDSNYIYVICYGSNHLKKGNYSIIKDFKLTPIILKDSNSYGEIVIPVSAVLIVRHDFGIQLRIKRSEVPNLKTTQYDGLAVVSGGELTIKST